MTIHVSLGVTAYNEEKAMPKLLRSIQGQKIPSGYCLSEIIIVSSACQDKTDDIIREFQKEDDRIILITEPEKRGKPSAMNKIMETFTGDIIIFSGADGFFESDTLYWMMKAYDDPSTSAVSGHPVPLNPKNTLWGYGAHLLWEMHHFMSLYYNDKLSGELCSIRRDFVFGVPEKEGGDDIYLERIVLSHGGKIAYEPRAIIYILGPQTGSDFFKQRRRVLGHIMKAERTTSMKGPTTDYLKILKTIIFHIKSMWSPYMIPVILVEMVARILADRDIRRGKITSNWTMVESTKSFS